MVKGTSKRVVVVKSPDPKVFEQAIFIVREDFLKGREGRSREILREAQEVADQYIKSAISLPRKPFRRILPFLIAGVLLVAAGVWFALWRTM